MSRREHQQPPQPPAGRALLLSPERASKLMALLDRLDLEPDPTQFDKYTRAGQVFFRLRPQEQTTGTGGGGGSSPLYASIVTLPDTDPVEYGVTVSTGFMEYQNAGASESDQGVTGYIVPLMNGLALDDPAVQPLPLPGLVSYVYLRFKTDADGVPKFAREPEFPGDPAASDGPATIEVFSEPQKSTHHKRPSPSGGEEEGDYYFLLLQTGSDGADTPAPIAVRRIPGNREQPNQLIEIANIGGERELYKGYLAGPEDKHEFRTIEQVEGRGEAIIKALDEGDPDADPPVPAEEEGETIKWKRIAQKATQAQIRVTTKGDDGEIIEIEGNGIDLGMTAGFAANYESKDGLATGVSDVAFGLDDTITITDGCGTFAHVIGLEKGLVRTYQLVFF